MFSVSYNPPQSDKRDFSGAIEADGQGATEAGVHVEGLFALIIASPSLFEHPRGGCPAEQPHLCRMSVAAECQGDVGARQNFRPPMTWVVGE